MPLKTFFQKKEMSNFGYDDDVLLKWEITGTGGCVGSYSHFNSMMEPLMQVEQSDNDQEPVSRGNITSKLVAKILHDKETVFRPLRPLTGCPLHAGHSSYL